jgi:hypothetical protein
MPHYHIRVADAAGSAAMPSVKPPSIKAPTAKPPKAPSAKPPQAPKPPGAGKPKQTVIAPQQAAQKRPSFGARATGLVRRATNVVHRADEFGEQFNRDGGAAMGHYHFNIPSRGSRRAIKGDNSVGASSWGGGKSTGYSISSTGASSWGGPGGSTGYKINTGGDSGTSEGAKKAAQTRSQGGSPYQSHSTSTPYWRGGELDIKAGSQTKQASPRRDPEPFRGYDSRRKK